MRQTSTDYSHRPATIEVLRYASGALPQHQSMYEAPSNPRRSGTGAVALFTSFTAPQAPGASNTVTLDRLLRSKNEVRGSSGKRPVRRVDPRCSSEVRGTSRRSFYRVAPLEPPHEALRTPYGRGALREHPARVPSSRPRCPELDLRRCASRFVRRRSTGFEARRLEIPSQAMRGITRSWMLQKPQIERGEH